MTRNLKTLGLALVAVFALSALAASVASAQNQGTLTSTGPVTLTGTETGTPNPTAGNVYDNALTSGILGKVTCNGTTYTGHGVRTHAETTAGNVHALISVPATTFTVTPHYATSCTAHVPVIGNRPMTITMNGCDYVYHIGLTTGGANTYGVTTDVKCPPNKKIETHIYKAGSVGHPDADAICTVKIGETGNQGLAGAHLTNTPAPDDFDLSGSFTNIHTENEGTLCGTSTTTTLTLDVDLTFTGHNAGGAQTGVTITDP